MLTANDKQTTASSILREVNLAKNIPYIHNAGKSIPHVYNSARVKSFQTGILPSLGIVTG